MTRPKNAPRKPRPRRGKTIDDVVLCDCAGCGAELLAPGDDNLFLAMRVYPTTFDRPRPVALRAGGRPYCGKCAGEPGHERRPA